MPLIDRQSRRFSVIFTSAWPKRSRRHLDSQHVEYYPVRVGGGDGPSYEIKLEEENDLVCEWDVYIALEFSSTDTLTQVHIKKEGTCR